MQKSRRDFIVAGNWKMNHTPVDAEKFVSEFVSDFKSTDKNCEVVIFPPALCWQALKASPLKWGLQHIHFAEAGAFTGEISIEMAKSIEVDYVLIGHSERRTLFAETDADVGKKVGATQAGELVPMICLGETLSEREAGSTKDVVLKQLRAALASADLVKDFVLAYEPVWAIGTGKVATPEIAQEVHGFLRAELSELGGQSLAEKISILYGGSVKPASAAELSQQADIDGFLVGGASLKAADFMAIVENSIV